ncbi:MAG: hypothetical protein AB7F31_06635 [Parachlamydiales bacterium]
MNVICSTTESIPTNRTSHGVKVLLSSLVFAFALHKLHLSKRYLAGGLVFSNLTFSIPWYTHAAISSVHKEHSPVPYNRLLNRIWGTPSSRRARVQFPLATGFEVAALALLLRGLGRFQLIGALAAAAGLAVRTYVLWTLLSYPPWRDRRPDDWSIRALLSLQPQIVLL